MYFNQKFDLSAFAMHRLGVFNPLIEQDSELFVDPKLLENSNDEFKESRNDLVSYFAGVVEVLKLSKKREDTFWIAARDLMLSKEKSGAGIGYSKAGKKGKGIGIGLASEIVDRACEIMPHVDYSPQLFELVGIFAKS